MAGAKDFLFFNNEEGLRKRLMNAPSGTSVIVFRQKQLPIRGAVDAELVEAALMTVPDGEEFLVVDLDVSVLGYFHWTAGETRAELIKELTDRNGKRVAVGIYPPWLYDTEDVMEAIVPDADGEVRRGVY